MRWIVQEWEPSDQVHGRWADVVAWTHTPGGDPSWEGADAGDAYRLAVLENRHHRLRSTSYRVLPYDDGATFNLTLNIDAAAHAAVPT